MNSSFANPPARKFLSTPLCSTFADGVAFATTDGGLLRFGPEARGPNEPGVMVNQLTAVAPIPGRTHGDEVNVFYLASAFVDSDGALWEKNCAISIFEIWRAILEVEHLESLEHPPQPGLIFEGAVQKSRRTLLEPIDTCCDGREQRLIEVITPPPPVSNNLSNSDFSQARFNRLLFRLRFKYFGARIGLIEERVSFAQPSGGEAHITRLAFTIQPLADTHAIARLDDSGELLGNADVRLMELGPLCARGVVLKSAWELSAGETPRRGDRDAWVRACQPYMESATLNRTLQPNPKVSHRRGDGVVHP